MMMRKTPRGSTEAPASTVNQRCDARVVRGYSAGHPEHNFVMYFPKLSEAFPYDNYDDDAE
eukprot:6040422-Karenia_brevis.AAC.1